LEAIGGIIAGGIAGYISARISYHFESKRDLHRIREEFDHRLREEQSKPSISVEDETWRKLQDAKEAVRVIYASSTLRSFPDLDRKTPEELEEFLHGSTLSPAQQGEIRRATRKSEQFVEFISGQEAFDATTSVCALRDYIVREKPYFSAKTAEDFLSCVSSLLEAIYEYHSWRLMTGIRPEPPIPQEGAQSLKEAMRLSDAIEAKLRQVRENRGS